MRLPRNVFLLMGVGVILAVAGCGGGGDKKFINPIDGAELVRVPSGTFTMGDAELQLPCDPSDRCPWPIPTHTVELTKGYYIYKYEVTIGQYKAFCAATARTMPPKLFSHWQGDDTTWYQGTTYDNYPIMRISWEDAAAYAAWAGAALPTEAQWEYAARGPQGRAYAWGNAWEGAKCANSVGNPIDPDSSRPVGSYPAGVSWCGAYDLTGNVYEWCADWLGAYTADPQADPTGPATGDAKVARGGGWGVDELFAMHAAFRDGAPPAVVPAGVGFRCVVSTLQP